MLKDGALEQLKLRMEELGITQQELARRTGLSQGGISHVLAGRREPRFSTVEKIAAALGEPLWQLLKPSWDPTRLSDLPWDDLPPPQPIDTGVSSIRYPWREDQPEAAEPGKLRRADPPQSGTQAADPRPGGTPAESVTRRALTGLEYDTLRARAQLLAANILGLLPRDVREPLYGRVRDLVDEAVRSLLSDLEIDVPVLAQDPAREIEVRANRSEARDADTSREDEGNDSSTPREG